MEASDGETAAPIGDVAQVERLARRAEAVHVAGEAEAAQPEDLVQRHRVEGGLAPAALGRVVVA
eukprot:2096142-Prymnesium_polylepis.1